MDTTMTIDDPRTATPELDNPTETVKSRPAVPVPDGLVVVGVPGTVVPAERVEDEGAVPVDVESHYRKGAKPPYRLLSHADIAGWFGVDATTVRSWRFPRSASAEDDPFPEPDFEIGEERPVPGWLPGRREEIEAWYARRPGRGRKPGQTLLGQH
jgi:hypothetical protein